MIYAAASLIALLSFDAIRLETKQAAQANIPSAGTYRGVGVDVAFQLVWRDNMLVMIGPAGEAQYRPDGERTYSTNISSADPNWKNYVRFVDASTVETWGTSTMIGGGGILSSPPQRYVLANAQTYQTYAANYNRAMELSQIEQAQMARERELADLEDARRRATSAPEGPMGPTLLEGIQGLAQRELREAERTRRELERNMEWARSGGPDRPRQFSSSAGSLSSAPDLTGSASATGRSNPQVAGASTSNANGIGWCWAAARDGFRVHYVSRMERTTTRTGNDLIVGGDNNTSWQETRQREFAAMIPASETGAPTCNTRPDPSGFDYIRSTLYNPYGGYRVIEMNWAPR